MELAIGITTLTLTSLAVILVLSLLWVACCAYVAVKYLQDLEERADSSTGRAPALQAGGCRFDPDSVHQGGVVQLAGHRLVTSEVVGSSPTVTAKIEYVVPLEDPMFPDPDDFVRGLEWEI